jgi:phage terminase small subunit
LKLTPKQKAFADAYIETGNQTEAARRAGYSERSAQQIASENLLKPVVNDYIKSRMAELESQRVASADEVMRFFSSVMRGEVKDQFGLDASLQDRLNAGKELMKRYAAVHDRESTNEARIILAADGGIEVDDGC